MTTNYRNEISKRTIRTAPQSGKHHGEGPSDGAQRNARIAAVVAAKKADREATKEKNIADRTAAAEKRKKETLAMATEESLIEELHSDYKLVKTGTKPTSAHPDGKPVYDVHHKGQKVATLSPISAYKDKKIPGKRYVASRKDITKYAIDSNANGLKFNSYNRYHTNSKEAAKYFIDQHQQTIKEETGTEARVKIKNVSRPDDPAPDSKDSKLVKTGEIKTKKIDEGRSMSINRNFGLPESLIAATRALLEKRNESANNVGKGKTVVDTDPETNDRDVNDDITEKKGKKKLDPVGKENDDIDNDGDVDKSDKYLHNRRKAIGKAMKEETSKDSDSAEIKKSLKVSDKEAKRLANFPKKPYNKDDIFTKEEVESVDEAKLSPQEFLKGARRAGSGSDEQLKTDTQKKNTGPGSGKIRQMARDELKRRGVKEEFSNEELARLEEIASKFNMSEASTERGLQDHEPRIVSGVKGMKSKPFSKKFPHAKAMDKWMDSDDYGNHEVHRIEKA